MAAPSAAAILSDLGADVIKIEPLTGDPMRNTTRPAKINGAFKGYDFQFDVDNRGKRSIAIDLDLAQVGTSCTACVNQQTCSCAICCSADKKSLAWRRSTLHH